MIRSNVILRARKLVNDTDTSNPFHSDAECHIIIDDKEREIRRRLAWPKVSQDISFAKGEGGNQTTKKLNTDFLSLTRVVMIPQPASNLSHYLLKPRTEHDQDRADPAWRDRTDQAQPAYYVVLDAVSALAQEFAQLGITTDRVCDGSYVMHVEGVELPAASTDGTKSPAIPGVYHEALAFALAAEMQFPRNPQKAQAYIQEFERRFRMAKASGAVIADEDVSIWGFTPNFGNYQASIVRSE